MFEIIEINVDIHVRYCNFLFPFPNLIFITSVQFDGSISERLLQKYAFGEVRDRHRLPWTVADSWVDTRKILSEDSSPDLGR